MRNPESTEKIRVVTESKFILVLTVFSIIASLLLERIINPIPVVFDEFAYLLQADTFSNFRFCNPPHPHWQHFENISILSSPCYISKYPPLQGLVLSFGQLLFDKPIYGSILTHALTSLLFYWMLLAWFPKKVSRISTLLFILHPMILAKFVISYWAASVILLASFLVFGAIGRLYSESNQIGLVASTYGIGIGLLLLSRPYEGSILFLTSFILIFSYLVKSNRKQSKLKPFVLTSSIPILVAICFWLLYNQKTTGDTLTPAYLVYENSYIQAPSLSFQKAKPAPNYNNKTIETHYQVELKVILERISNFKNLFTYNLIKIPKNLLFYCSWTFFLALPFIYKHARDKKFLALLGLIILFVTFALFPATHNDYHYSAPIAGGLFILFLKLCTGFISIANTKATKHITVSLLILVFFSHQLQMSYSYLNYPKQTFQRKVQNVKDDLKNTKKRHLVFVKFSDPNDFIYDFVYNSADIDKQKIVIARDLGKEKNQALINYYRNSSREVWLLNIDKELKLHKFIE